LKSYDGLNFFNFQVLLQSRDIRSRRWSTSGLQVRSQRARLEEKLGTRNTSSWK